MAHHTDNLGDSSLVIQNHALADRILVREKLSRENIVDDDHTLRMLIVLRRKKPPALQRNSHYLQIIFLYNITHRPVHVVVALWLWFSFDPKQNLIVAAERHCGPRKRN